MRRLVVVIRSERKMQIYYFFSINVFYYVCKPILLTFASIAFIDVLARAGEVKMDIFFNMQLLVGCD